MTPIDDHQPAGAAPAPSTPTYQNNGPSNGRNGHNGGSGGPSAFGAEPMTPSPVAASITAIPRDHARGVDPEVGRQCGVGGFRIGCLPLCHIYTPTAALHTYTFFFNNQPTTPPPPPPPGRLGALHPQLRQVRDEGGPLHRHRAAQQVARHAPDPRLLRGVPAPASRDPGPEPAHSVGSGMCPVMWCPHVCIHVSVGAALKPSTPKPAHTPPSQSQSHRRMNLSGTGVTNVKPAPGNGDSNARVLHQVLASNTAIETLVRVIRVWGNGGCFHGGLGLGCGVVVWMVEIRRCCTYRYRRSITPTYPHTYRT